MVKYEVLCKLCGNRSTFGAVPDPGWCDCGDTYKYKVEAKRGEFQKKVCFLCGEDDQVLNYYKQGDEEICCVCWAYYTDPESKVRKKKHENRQSRLFDQNEKN